MKARSLRKTVAAVYDRRQSSNCEIAGYGAVNELTSTETPLLSQEGCLRASASRRGGSKAVYCKASAMEPPRLAALGTPPNLGGEFSRHVNSFTPSMTAEYFETDIPPTVIDRRYSPGTHLLHNPRLADHSDCACPP